MNSKLDAYATRIASARTKFEAARKKAILEAPAEYGFESFAEFAAAVNAINAENGKPAAASPKAGAPRKRRTRARITPELRSKVIEMLASGHTYREVAQTTHMSEQSVYNIRKAEEGKKSAAPAKKSAAKKKAAKAPKAKAVKTKDEKPTTAKAKVVKAKAAKSKASKPKAKKVQKANAGKAPAQPGNVTEAPSAAVEATTKS